MIAPKGYRPILEVDYLAAEAAETMMNAELGEKAGSHLEEHDSPEGRDELHSIIATLYNQSVENRNVMVDRYLERVERLFLARHDGLVLSIAKQAILPERKFYYDQEDYLANRDNHYDCIDTHLWLVDAQKSERMRARLRDALDSFVAQPISYWEHPRFPELVRRFDGWSLCVPESSFPRDVQKLSELLKLEDASPSNEGSVSKQILSYASNPKTTKADIRQRFPHLSARQFDFHWRVAAETRPDLSKPGRKS